MKKLVAIILVLCIAFTLAISYKDIQAIIGKIGNPAAPTESGDSGAAAPAEEAQAPAEVTPTFDMEKLAALHDMDEVVATVGDREVTWREYLYFLNTSIINMESQLQQIQMYYGSMYKWDEAIDDSGTTVAAYTVKAGETDMRQVFAGEQFILANAPTYAVDDGEQIAAQVDQLISSMGEDKEKILSENYITREFLEELIGISNYGYKSCFNTLYGENCEKITDEEALAYLTEGGYMNANHILFTIMDMETGERMDDEAKAAKRQQAEELAAELAKISDTEELLKVFAEKKEELCEDTGKVVYPDGYVFPAGTMVKPFEDAVGELEDNQVSGVVETDYGYHIILRLPLDPDKVISNEQVSARAAVANKAMNAALEENFNNTPLEFKEGFESPKLEDYLIEK